MLKLLVRISLAATPAFFRASTTFWVCVLLAATASDAVAISLWTPMLMYAISGVRYTSPVPLTFRDRCGGTGLATMVAGPQALSRMAVARTSGRIRTVRFMAISYCDVLFQ